MVAGRTLKFSLILVAAILVRLLMLAVVVPSTGGDGVHYLKLAHNGFAALSDSFRPPLYPLVISPALALGGTPMVFALQSAITIGVALYASRWTFAGALLIATSPFLIVSEYAILAEILTIALLTIGWLVLFNPGARNAIFAGVLLGLASLTRETIVLLPLFALPFGWWFGRLKDFAIAAIIATLLYLPWAIHSADGGGRFGYNLWVGTWERNDLWYRDGIANARYPDSAFTSPQQRAILKFGADDGLFKAAAIERIKTDPGFVVSNWIARYPKLWLGTRTDQSELKLAMGSIEWRLFKMAAWGLAFVSLVFGMLCLWRKPMLAIPVVYTALIYIPFHNIETRYSLVVLPCLYIAIGLTIDRIRDAKPDWRNAWRRLPIRV